MPCAACEAKLPQTSFRPADVSNHFSRAQTVICMNCRQRGCNARRHDLHRCAGPCNKLLGHTAFSRRELRMKARRHSVVCIACKKIADEKEQKLRKLMKKSKRAACTCKRQLTHAEKCPMHMNYAGEQPYPGCDVMSREDSDWFQMRINKYKASRDP